MSNQVLFGKPVKSYIDNKIHLYVGRLGGRGQISRVVLIDEELYPEMRQLGNDRELEIYQGVIGNKLVGLAWLDPLFYDVDIEKTYEKIRKITDLIQEEFLQNGYVIHDGVFRPWDPFIIDHSRTENDSKFREGFVFGAKIPEGSMRVLKEALDERVRIKK